MRTVVVTIIVAIFISSCSTQLQNTPTVVVETQTPIAPTAIIKPSTTPDLKGWETLPAEVLLLYDPTTPHAQFPPAAKLTETVAKRKFQFNHPLEFRFFDTAHGSLMENKEKNIMISLELYEHNGKGNSAGFLGILLDGKMYKPISNPVAYTFLGYEGWIVNIESPAVYDHGIGQLIMVDIDSSNLFYAIGLAKPYQWKLEGKQAYYEVLNSITFTGFK